MGWMFKDVEALKAVPKLSADLIKDPYYRFLNKYFLLLQIPIGLSLYAIGQCWQLIAPQVAKNLSNHLGTMNDLCDNNL